MEDDSKNWWAANVMKIINVMIREVFNDPIIILILNQTLLSFSEINKERFWQKIIDILWL